MRLFPHFFSLGHATVELSPLTLPSGANLRAWYDINQETAFNDGDTLTPLTNQISDLADSDFAVQDGAPQYETNELDGEPVVEFSTTVRESYNQVSVSRSIFDFMWSGASSLMVIFKPENHALDSVYQLIDCNRYSPTNKGFHVTGTDVGEMHVRVMGNSGLGVSLIATGSLLIFGTWYIAFMRQSGNGGNATLYLDNVSVQTDASIADLAAGDSTHLCQIGERTTLNEDEFGGQISQILLWDADVESDRQALHDYFANRFPTLNL